MTFGHLALPMLPVPPSWFPGHMMKFKRMLPSLLTKTDVVLEIRDSRLPLTSINRDLEGALQKWRLERGWDPNNPARRLVDTTACERIVVLNKRDLVPDWGFEPFRRSMTKRFPSQNILFASWQRPKDIGSLNDILVNIAKRYPHSMELNVLVIGMPNVGKSTLLNALRNLGIKGRTPKALRTSALPGLTQALSTRLKLSLDPLVYAFDSPGIMLPYLGRGPDAAERGVKLALIAGIKEGMYDIETLAAYLLYRLNVLNPISPAYLNLLPPRSKPTTDLDEFLEHLGQRMGMLKRGGEIDLGRAAVYFVRWWREEGGLAHAKLPFDAFSGDGAGAETPQSVVQGWGFDFQWEVTKQDLVKLHGLTGTMPPGSGSISAQVDTGGRDGNQGDVKAELSTAFVQEKMEACIDKYKEMAEKEEKEEFNVSSTQRKKQAMLEEKERRKMRYAARKAARRS